MEKEVSGVVTGFFRVPLTSRSQPHFVSAGVMGGGVSQQSGVTQRDLNVKEAWAQGYTGHGIVVSILDDGIEKNHPDLAGNYVRRWGREAVIPARGVLGRSRSVSWSDCS